MSTNIKTPLLRHLVFALLLPWVGVVFTISRAYYFKALFFGALDKSLETSLVMVGLSTCLFAVLLLSEAICSRHEDIRSFQPIGLLYFASFGFFFHSHLKPIYQFILGYSPLLIFVVLVLPIAVAKVAGEHVQKAFVFCLLVVFTSSLIGAFDLHQQEQAILNKRAKEDFGTLPVFKKRPSIYLIQPDSYVNIASLSKPPFNIDVSPFLTELQERNFTLYDHFRSNFDSTLPSNLALFRTKNHGYEGVYGTNKSEMLAARHGILQSNFVLDTLHHNGYESYMLPNSRYLMVEGCGFKHCPEIGSPAWIWYYSSVSDVYLSVRSFLSSEERSTRLEKIMEEEPSPRFVFLEDDSKPGHISSILPIPPPTPEQWVQITEQQRKSYERKVVEITNKWLIDLVTLIDSKDPESIIIIMSDHGPSLGNKCLLCPREVESIDELNEAQRYASFGSFLAIRWPREYRSELDDKIKTTVNFFPLLFSWLTDSNYQFEPQPDSSYLYLSRSNTTVVALDS
jgi:hypothetical protein